MKVRFILFFLVFGMLTGCTKNDQHPVPSIPFDISIDISLPSYSALMGVSGWAYVNGGSRGIIVYRRGVSDFVAFDRHSPADPVGTSCDQPLVPDDNNFLQLNDTCNNATFSLYDGSPISNSVYGLRMYQTMWDGNQNLRIFN
ncbi:MAG: hypothetical protein HWE22_02980 [Flavobacteriales bacterium]|nr:hypothetical protein [Flavobacteriales bacterium]PIE86956.1 MAG: hypothetical protein CSA03_02940 [Bacteroidota bacterium]